jgi:hypothetical protein
MFEEVGDRKTVSLSSVEIMELFQEEEFKEEEESKNWYSRRFFLN